MSSLIPSDPFIPWPHCLEHLLSVIQSFHEQPVIVHLGSDFKSVLLLAGRLGEVTPHRARDILAEALVFHGWQFHGLGDYKKKGEPFVMSLAVHTTVQMIHLVTSYLEPKNAPTA